MIAAGLCLVLFLAATALVTRSTAPETFAASVGTAFVVLTGIIVTAAHGLPFFGALGNLRWWAGAGGIALTLAAIASQARRHATFPSCRGTLLACLAAVRADTFLAAMAITVIVAGLLNAAVILLTAPGGWDALSYHLPKMAYGLQNGTFRIDVANYWAQQVHPTNWTALLTFAFLTGGRNDHLLGLWQFSAYWTAMVAIGATAREAGGTVRQALWGALTFGLLTNALMQSTDDGNDLILAAYTAIVVYALLTAARTSTVKPIWIAGAAAGLALGVKATFLIAVPSLALLAAAALARADRGFRTTFAAHLAAASLAGLLLFSLTAGYVENVRKWGNPFLGPPEARRSTGFEGLPLGSRLEQGSRNLVRYVFDSLSADGLPRLGVMQRGHDLARRPLEWAAEAAGLDLENPAATNAPFSYDRLLSAHEAHAFWGILGVLALWPAMLLGAIRGRGVPRALAIAALLFFPVLAYVAQYAPWHGRYFLMSAVFAAPAAGIWLGRDPAGRYARLTAVAGCAAALTAVLLRSNEPVLTVRYGSIVRSSVFTLDRVQQMTRNKRNMEAPLRAFDATVPPDARVAACLPPSSLEYAVFGNGLTRRVVPAPPGTGAGAAIAQSDWYLFDRSCEDPRATDLELGAGWWLRRKK